MAPTRIQELLDALARECGFLGVSVEEILEEKHSEIALRAFLRCIPNSRLKSEQLVEYLRAVLGSDPDPELLIRLEEARRGPRLSDEEILDIDRRQRSR